MIQLDTNWIVSAKTLNPNTFYLMREGQNFRVAVLNLQGVFGIVISPSQLAAGETISAISKISGISSMRKIASKLECNKQTAHLFVRNG